jgi:hypothetical protein
MLIALNYNALANHQYPSEFSKIAGVIEIYFVRCAVD